MPLLRVPIPTFLGLMAPSIVPFLQVARFPEINVLEIVLQKNEDFPLGVSQLSGAEVGLLCTVSIFSSRNEQIEGAPWMIFFAVHWWTMTFKHTPLTYVCNQYCTHVYNSHTYMSMTSQCTCTCGHVHTHTHTPITQTVMHTHRCNFTRTPHTLNASLILAQTYRSAYHTYTKICFMMPKVPLSYRHVPLVPSPFQLVPPKMTHQLTYLMGGIDPEKWAPWQNPGVTHLPTELFHRGVPPLTPHIMLQVSSLLPFCASVYSSINGNNDNSDPHRLVVE